MTRLMSTLRRDEDSSRIISRHLGVTQEDQAEEWSEWGGGGGGRLISIHCCGCKLISSIPSLTLPMLRIHLSREQGLKR